MLAQQRIVDATTCNNWEHLEDIADKSCLLSSNGRWIMFRKKRGEDRATTTLKNLVSGWEKEFPSSHEVSFDNDRMLAFELHEDSLVILDTEKDIFYYHEATKGFFTIKSKFGDKVAFYVEEYGKRLLRLWDFKQDRTTNIGEVSHYWLNEKGTLMVSLNRGELRFTNLKTYKHKRITSREQIQELVINENGSRIVWISGNINGYDLRYFNTLTERETVLLTDTSHFLKYNRELRPHGLSFQKSEKIVFFKISKSPSDIDPKDVITADVDVWSYHDLYLQPSQLPGLKAARSEYTSLINVDNGKAVQIESDEVELALYGNTSKYCMFTTKVNENESYWNGQNQQLYLYSVVADKKIKVVEGEYPGIQPIGISPDDRFLVWFDRRDRNYYSYEIEKGRTLNISKSITEPLSVLHQRGQDAKTINMPLAYPGQYWIRENNILLIYSRNDIWQIDLTGTKHPISLTKGYGNSRDITFRVVDVDKSPFFLSSRNILVWAFDYRSKQNGFWKVTLGKSANPEKLVMTNDAYYFHPISPVLSANNAEDPNSFAPIKAIRKEVFVLRKMNSLEPPNLFTTTDFKKFTKISRVDRPAEYVQIMSKLITYKLPDGSQAEGVLHTPLKFDSTKKYPIIFNYYERRSETLNQYRSPALSGHNINIPWYVSRGYLVFEPDFYYWRGKTAESLISEVASAVSKLSSIPYVDISRMGAQGQSFGGYETNVLATQSHFFKAACEMAGYTNIISEYGSIRPDGYNNQIASDLLQRNLGVFPWDNPEVFIANSPVFHVANMNTPLLMVHNKNDGAVSFSHAVELFLAARRLGKRVWLLQYDGEGHTNEKYENKLDFTIRMQQFFDHYLKGAPMPLWMSRGIPAKMKGIESGLACETDTSDFETKEQNCPVRKKLTKNEDVLE